MVDKVTEDCNVDLKPLGLNFLDLTDLDRIKKGLDLDLARLDPNLTNVHSHFNP